MKDSSRWDQYKVYSNSDSPTKWDQYKINQVSQGDSWPSLIGKSFAKGVTSLADIPQAIGSFVGESVNPEHSLIGKFRKGYNLLKGEEHIPLTGPRDYLPEIPLASSVINNQIKNISGIDLEPKPGSTTQNIASHAAQFAGGMGPFGLLSKGNKVINAIKNVGTGASIGGTSGTLQEGGINPLAADIIGTVIHPTSKNVIEVFKKAKEAPLRVPIKLMGLTPKGMNIPAAKAAQELGIDLPAAALTNSKLTNLADQVVGKTPYFGNKLGEKYAKAEKQTKNVLENIYEEVGPKRTPEIEAEISKLYDVRAKSLPSGATVKPVHLEKAIDGIKINTSILSPDEKNLLNSLDIIKKEIKPESSLKSELGTINLPLQDYSVDKLVGTKKSLNQIIKWDMDEGVKNQLRKVQNAVSKDIAEYGKNNPSWYKSFKEADDLFSKVARREKLEKHLSGSINPSTADLGYAALSKRIHNPKHNELIKKQVSPEVFSKIEKLGEVAKAMALKNRAVPNPSGTAPVSAVLGFMANMYRPEALVGILGTAGTTKLLTDKKFLDLALKYAEKGTPSIGLSMALSKRIKDLTGASPVILNRAFSKEDAKEEKKDGL